MDGVQSLEEFEVIEIIDDINPYLVLLGIEWAFEKNSIINLKKRHMSFEDGKNRVTTPIDPMDGHRYVEPIKAYFDLDNIYNLTTRKVDYVHLTFDGKLRWRSTSSCDSHLYQNLESWQNRLHEVSVRRCTYMMKSMQWIGSEVSEPPSFDAINDLDSFVYKYQMKILEKDRLRALDIALKATLARWWATHKKHIKGWPQYKTLMKIRFSTTLEYVEVEYTGQTSLKDHIYVCLEAWQIVPWIEWVHKFVTILNTIPKNWYVELELQDGTKDWAEMIRHFLATFSFEDESPAIDVVLHKIRGKVFTEHVMSEEEES